MIFQEQFFENPLDPHEPIFYKQPAIYSKNAKTIWMKRVHEHTGLEYGIFLEPTAPNVRPS